MRNIVAILGILACGLSGVVMCASTLLPMTLAPFSSFFCQDDEQLTGEVWTAGNEMRSSVGTTYLCVDKNGNERAVTPSVVSKTTTVFLVLMFGGMGLLGLAGWHSVKTTPATQKAKRKNDQAANADTADDNSGLTEALRELEESRAAGLITEDEYQQMRQKVMERFG